MTRRDESGAVKVGRSIRSLLFFFAYTAGVLFAIDAIFFAGQYRTDAWRNVTYQGLVFDLDVRRWLRKSLW
jgi:hypothetical protein